MKKKRLLVLMISSAVFYGAMFLLFGVGIYGDSQQYIDMHIHREPGYCFFLWLVRQIVRDLELSLHVAVVLQNILATVVTATVVNFFSEEFSLKKIETLLLLLLHFAPHVVTIFMSRNSVVLANSILSEGLCYPIFQIFIVFCYKSMYDKGVKSNVWCCILGFLLAITRSQFMIAFLIWMVLQSAKHILDGKYKRVAVVILVTAILFVSRGYVIKSYNYVFNEKHFISNTYGGVNTLANVMYASDREDGERIESEVTREFFYRMYDEMVAQGWNRERAGEGVLAQGIFLEEGHDRIKFDVLDPCFSDGLHSMGYSDYYDINIIADDMSMDIMKSVLPSCFGVWLGNYFVLAFRGMMRCIGIPHPIIGIAVWAFYLFGFAMCFYELYKKKWSKEGWLMFIALLSILALSFSTAMTIMCLSRYMVYGFVPFYTAMFVILKKHWEINSHKIKNRK